MAQPTPQPNQTDPRMAAYLRQQALNEQAMRQQYAMQQEAARQTAMQPEQIVPVPQQPAVERPVQPVNPEIQHAQPLPVEKVAQEATIQPGAQESRTAEQIVGLTAGQPEGVMPVIPNIVPEALSVEKVSDELEASADKISSKNLSEGASVLEEKFGNYIEEMSDPNRIVN